MKTPKNLSGLSSHTQTIRKTYVKRISDRLDDYGQSPVVQISSETSQNLNVDVTAFARGRRKTTNNVIRFGKCRRVGVAGVKLPDDKDNRGELCTVSNAHTTKSTVEEDTIWNQ